MSWQQILLDEAYYQLGLEWHRIPIVILASIGIYLAFMLLVKVFGSRVLTSMTASDAVIIIMFGAVAGRVIVGVPPSLAAGVLGLATLMGLEAAFGVLRNAVGWSRFIDRKPILIMHHGEKVEANADFAHVSDTDIYSAIRKAGLGSKQEVQAMILEPTGQIAVIQEGKTMDPDVFRSVKGLGQD